MSGPRVAYQGAPGAFSHEALLHHLPDAGAVGFETFEDVFKAVEAGDCALALLPVENSLAGPVPEVAALLDASGLQARAEHPWPIRLQLMAAPGVTLDTVRWAVSHPMALKQCVAFLREQGLGAETAFDTAGAAEALARAPDPTRAVLAPRAAAALYGLVILAEDVQDRSDSVTRFLLLERR